MVSQIHIRWLLVVIKRRRLLDIFRKLFLFVIPRYEESLFLVIMSISLLNSHKMSLKEIFPKGTSMFRKGRLRDDKTLNLSDF